MLNSYTRAAAAAETDQYHPERGKHVRASIRCAQMRKDNPLTTD